MKIGFFTDRYYPQVDGVAVSVDLFAKELRKLGHEVIIFCPQGKRKDRKHEDHVVRFPSIPAIWYEDYRDTFPWTRANIAMVKHYNLDIVHIHTPAQIGMLGMLIAKQQNLPIVTTYHTDIEQYSKVYKRIVVGVLMGTVVGSAVLRDSNMIKRGIKSILPNRKINRWNRKVVIQNLTTYLNLCNLVISPSKKITHKLHEYHTTSRVVTLPTGVDPEETTSSINYHPRTVFGIQKHDPLLLFVGRLGEEKNIQQILRAMPHVLDKHPGAHLLIVGDGPYAEELKAETHNLGLEQSVHFTGLLDRAETFSCFSQADLFVFPSTTDTQGLVITEAAIKSKPIVFVDDEISPVTIDHETGLQADGTTRGLTKAIIHLLDKPTMREKYGAAAREEAMKITIAKQAEKLHKFYQSVL